jgi:hypothetical protein
MSRLALAEAVAAHYAKRGYPFLGLELHRDGPYPSVGLWDDNSQILRLIVCCESDDERDAAQVYGQQVIAADRIANPELEDLSVALSVCWPTGVAHEDG